MTPKFLSLVICVATVSLYPNQPSLSHKSAFDKTFGKITSSLPFYTLEALNPAGLFVYLDPSLGTVPASALFQNLGKEAQISVGIPPFFNVPIRKFRKDVSIAGCQTPHAIYVNEEKKSTYGVDRMMIYHEAIHKKYNDFTTTLYAIPGITMVSSIIINFVLKSILNIKDQEARALISVTAALASSYIGAQKMLRLCERRADTEALYIAACHTCAHDVVDARTKSEVKNNLATHGYLLSHEINKIAQELKEQNKICKFHEAQAALDKTPTLSS